MNKRRTLFNLFVFALVLVLLLNTTQFPVSAEDYYDKIDPNLLDYMNTVDDEESIPISVF